MIHVFVIGQGALSRVIAAQTSWNRYEHFLLYSSTLGPTHDRGILLYIQCFSDPSVELPGDLDGNGVVNMTDAVGTTNALLSTGSLDGLTLIATDLDENLELNISVEKK